MTVESTKRFGNWRRDVNPEHGRHQTVTKGEMNVCMKHIDMIYIPLCDLTEKRVIQMIYCPMADMTGQTPTKLLAKDQFEDL